MPHAKTAAGRKSVMDAARVRRVLAASIYFRELPAESLDLLATIAKPVRFKDGDLIQAARPIQPRFFIVMSGALRLTTPPSPDGSTTILAVTGPGGFFGAGRFLTPNLVWGQAYAVGETELGVVEGGVFRDALKSDPHLERHISAQLVRRFNALISIFADVVKGPFARRLARRLLTQALTLKRGPGEAAIEIDVTQSMLAEMLGASRSSVSAELRKWDQQKIIRLAYRRLYILDIGALCGIAGPDVTPY